MLQSNSQPSRTTSLRSASSQIGIMIAVAFVSLALVGCGAEPPKEPSDATSSQDAANRESESEPANANAGVTPAQSKTSQPVVAEHKTPKQAAAGSEKPLDGTDDSTPNASPSDEQPVPQVTQQTSAKQKTSQAGTTNVTSSTTKSPENPVNGAYSSDSTADSADSKPKSAKYPKTIENLIGMKLVLIPKGEFLMGSPETEEGRKLGELQRKVRIEEPFYMGVYEVTQAQYEEIMKQNRSVERGPNLPVGFVSVKDAMRFCERLSVKEDQTYRLPTEAEWEYACRAGTTTPFHYGDKLTSKDANFHGGYPYGTDESGPNLKEFQPVGSYKPNAFGLYDMHGNAAEWCLDRLRDRKYLHICRGGYCTMSGEICRSAFRWPHNIGWRYSGLRVVRTVEPVEGEIEMPLTHDVDQAEPFQTDELLERIDEAFAKQVVPLLPAVVIFPAVDAEGRVRPDGVALSLTANYQTAYSPQRRMDIGLSNMRARLRAAGCFKLGSTIDKETIAICLESLGVKKYVLPKLTEQDGKLTLSVAVQHVDQFDEPQSVTHTFDSNQLTSIPGMIARETLQQIDAKLDEQELAYLSIPHFRRSEDVLNLSRMAYTSDFGENNKSLLRVVLQNPRSLASWEMFVFDSYPAEDALTRFENSSHQMNCDRLQICASVRKKPSQGDFVKLLELAPQFRNETYYYGALAIIAMNLSEPELVKHVLEKWREADTGYSGCHLRGDFLIDWAWHARGSGWASEVTDEGWKLFRGRLKEAQEELERAVQINPQGWEAHTHLITIGMARNLPLEFVDDHFLAAIQVRPRFARAYSKMFQTLQPRWGGVRDELVSFAFLCVSTGHWDEGIPEVGRRALEELGTVPGPGAFKRSVFRDQELWATFSLYAKGAQEIEQDEVAGIPNYKRFASNMYAKYGGYGGHIDDVAPTFRRLEKEGIDTRVFWDGFTYEFLRDLVFSQTESGNTQAICATRAALDVGDFDKAEEWIAKIQPDTKEFEEFVTRAKKAVEIGRELLAKRSITLTPETICQMFYGIDSNWEANGDTLQCRAPANTTCMILLPFGIENAEITGTVSWDERPEQFGIHTHTRALRDNVTVAYELSEHFQNLTLYRTNRRRRRARFQGHRSDFHLILGKDEDQLTPAEQVSWTTPAIEQVPSGIAFQVVSNKQHHSVVKLTNLKIKLLD